MPKTHSSCHIKNIGTHWVCCAPSHDNNKTLWYFDSFGMLYLEEFKMRLIKDGMHVIYNANHYQDIHSVLCGYYCLYCLHQWSMKKDFYDIIKPFSQTNTKSQ